LIEAKKKSLPIASQPDPSIAHTEQRNKVVVLDSDYLVNNIPFGSKHNGNIVKSHKVRFNLLIFLVTTVAPIARENPFVSVHD